MTIVRSVTASYVGMRLRLYVNHVKPERNKANVFSYD
jgi:hypothetical protein